MLCVTSQFIQKFGNILLCFNIKGFSILTFSQEYKGVNMKNTKKLHVMGAIICGLLSFGYAEEHKHWSYDEVSKWGDIANEFHACKYGKYQSPINIESQNIIPAKSKNNLHFSYLNNTAQNVVNNGHSIQVNFKSGSSFTLQNTKFELVQVRFHTPSEYTIDCIKVAMGKCLWWL